jgi:glycine/sarcosine N-methyltransferase
MGRQDLTGRWHGDLMRDPRDFYDDLANDYHALFDDWWTAAQWHGGVIAALLAVRGVAPPSSLLDCTCGIGTQALPLAALGYSVTGTDISPRSVARARVEGHARNLPVRLGIADVRVVDETIEERFDAVISCDNALPHLLTDADLHRALRSIRRCLRDDGVLLASVRDYDSLAAARPVGTPVSVHGTPGSRHGSGQAWTWSPDGQHVDITLFILNEQVGGDGWRVSAHETRYRALRRASLTSALDANGFRSIEWLPPLESGYYQPIVIARAN